MELGRIVENGMCDNTDNSCESHIKRGRRSDREGLASEFLYQLLSRTRPFSVIISTSFCLVLFEAVPAVTSSIASSGVNKFDDLKA